MLATLYHIPEAILCDRDGTLIEDEHFLSSPAQIRWIKGVKPLLKTFKEQGIKVIVITNQSGVARQYFEPEAVETIHRQLQEDVRETGGEIKDFYYCPHHPQGSHPDYGKVCDCRKPSPGMFLQAIQDHHLDPKRCWVVGDRLRDLEPGLTLGMKAFLVQTGAGIEHQNLLSQATYRGQITVIASLAEIFKVTIN